MTKPPIPHKQLQMTIEIPTDNKCNQYIIKNPYIFLPLKVVFIPQFHSALTDSVSNFSLISL